MSLEERVEIIEDREAIHELIAHYCRGVDQKDEKLFLSIWHEDGKWTIGEPFGNHQGIHQIKDILNTIWEALPETHHFTANEVIKVNGETATAVSDVGCTATDAKGRALLIAATYWDDLKKSNGTWKIAERNVRIYYMTPVVEPWSLDPETRMAL
ncbi:MAG: nuclear transport factor 2 family protein [Actinomycetota bacterium]|jgi:ketosteroid isomerase-like protein